MLRRERSGWALVLYVAGGIMTVGGALAAIREWSPFAWSWDLQQVAQVTYQTAINQDWDLWLQAQAQLQQAEQAQNWPLVQELQRQLKRLEDEIKYYQELQSQTGQP